MLSKRKLLIYTAATLVSSSVLAQTIPNVQDLLPLKQEVLEAIRTSISAAVFESNDAQTRATLAGSITEKLQPIKLAGRLTDFIVQCDEKNNPKEVIDKNELNLYIFTKRGNEIFMFQVKIDSNGVSVSIWEPKTVKPEGIEISL